MKKLLVWATMTALFTAGAAFADGRNLVAQPNATFAFGVNGAGAGPTTTNNDDSCDISTAPAATLLLPYFEVDMNSPQTTARTTLFTVTNVSALPQIAHVTVWTDWSFPVLDFNIFLTGYDVQSINMYDVLRGVIAPQISGAPGTSNATDEGKFSFANDENPNFLPNAATQCASLPGNIPASILQDLRTALTTGAYSTCGSTRVGSAHANAIGYVTIDVAATCSTTLPTDPTYYTGELLYDNVLIGDYQDINPNPATGNYAGGNPLVHIRAIPEGGPAGGAGVVTNLPYTFYNRYTNGTGNRYADRRQPLPSTFAARFIQGGTGNFNTDYKIWREGITPGGTVACSQYSNNGVLAIRESIRFDEHENPNTQAGGIIISPAPSGTVSLPETSRTSSASAVFPTFSSPSGDVSGWMYMNLNNGGSNNYSVNPVGGINTAAYAANATTVRPSQNWVIVSMSAEGRYAVDFDAAWLGNGCSAPAATVGQATVNFIGPAGGTPVCPQGAVGCTPRSLLYPGTNVTP